MRHGHVYKKFQVQTYGQSFIQWQFPSKLKKITKNISSPTFLSYRPQIFRKFSLNNLENVECKIIF